VVLLGAGVVAFASWAYFGPLFSSSQHDGTPFYRFFGAAGGSHCSGCGFGIELRSWSHFDEIQMGSLADKAEANPRIAAFLRERIETHGELARRDYEAAWTMYESGLRSKAEIDAVKEKDAAEKRLSAALRIKA
jgi:hypothetical protein